ncbi:hypothetical protein BUALT_Bualt03G0027900 [Buddleja alternifolia]|uniref:Cytochrome b561 domain-containing protein n=1 Tax=Buddleja alternifolia TaxID=168488 RepID=A0AAV6XSV3_9LAMI|nr:hypothetical protein BUALT_Bualt03G0027900 [Buddleja alternifolia]
MLHILLDQKMHPLSTLSSLLSLLCLVHFAECSSYEARAPHNHTIIEQHVNSHKTFDIMVHGILLWASMGFLMPVGILTMRMSSTRDCRQTTHKIVFYVHAILQVLTVLLVTIGAVLSIRKFENAFDNNHQRIGLALYGAIYVQIMIGCRRPKRGAKGRSAWYFSHWILGTTISLVGILNIYTGLQAYHKRTSKSTTLWSIIFTAQVSVMAIFYLFQDKWEYMQKQGRIMAPADGGVQGSSTGDQINNQKDELDESFRRSNALGAYFSRSNALNKLFQLT